MQICSLVKADLDVGIQRVRPKNGGGSLVPLNLVLLKGGYVTAVCIGQPCQYDHDVLPPRSLHLKAMQTQGKVKGVNLSMHLNVCIEGVRSVGCCCTLKALHLVLFPCRDVAGIAVGQTSNDDCQILTPVWSSLTSCA